MDFDEYIIVADEPARQPDEEAYPELGSYEKIRSSTDRNSVREMLVRQFNENQPHSSDRPDPTRPDLSGKDELKSRFDKVVGMNSHHTAEKGVSMATYGLSGCIAGYIDNPKDNTLFHYSPLSTDVKMMEFLVNQKVSDNTNGVHLFLPGTWHSEENKDFAMVPHPLYEEKMLKSIIDDLRASNVQFTLNYYNEDHVSGNDYIGRSQGAVWLEKSGDLYAEGMPVRKADPASPKTTAATSLSS